MCAPVCVLCVKSFHPRELSFVLASGVAFGADSLVLGNSLQWALYLFLYKANIHPLISKKAMQLTEIYTLMPQTEISCSV